MLHNIIYISHQSSCFYIHIFKVYKKQKRYHATNNIRNSWIEIRFFSTLLYSTVNFSYYLLRDKFINPNHLSGFGILKSYLFSLSQVLLSSICTSINYPLNCEKKSDPCLTHMTRFTRSPLMPWYTHSRSTLHHTMRTTHHHTTRSTLHHHTIAHYHTMSHHWSSF